MSSIFEVSLSTSEIQEAFSPRSFLQAMLRFEAALARAQAQAGLIPAAAAQSIAGTCKVELFDVAKMVRDSERAGSIAAPLVKGLKETVGLFNQEAAGFVHFGASDQDLLDTALALVTRDALALIRSDVHQAVAALLALAGRHAADPVLARPLAQPSPGTTFGLRCAGWAAPLVRSLQRLELASANALSLQLGGAAGTLADMQAQGPQVAAQMAAELQLKAPLLGWHTQRDEWVALGCELGLLTGSLGKIAQDLSLMGQHEVGEVSLAAP
ncbi:MAG: 3-carboxy-cis,cis-muconate cycloisomerase, partial [Polaromonas sp.]|nr:3-carboxy-cis,cis-muconate cycloisomerase [Polaromonas sp.]